MPHVIFTPLAVDYGLAGCNSNQSHRSCVTLGEVRTHLRPADGLLLGHRMTVGMVLPSSLLLFPELCDQQLERREGGRWVFLRHLHISKRAKQDGGVSLSGDQEKQNLSLSCWYVERSRAIRRCECGRRKNTEK